MIAEGLTPVETNALLKLAQDHPWVTAICLFLVVLIITVAGTLAFLLSDKDRREFFRSWFDARSQDRKDREAADDALRSVIADFELAKLALSVAADAVQRFNRLRSDRDSRKWGQARVHLLDWIRSIFGFSKSDINKVTVWRSDGTHLRPHTWNGISPESGAELALEIHPGIGGKDTFAAMAYRSGELQFCDDIFNDARYQPLARAPRHPYLSLVAVPVKAGEEVVAVLTIDSLVKSAFSGADAQRLAKLSAALVALLLFEPKAAEEDGEEPVEDDDTIETQG